MQLDTTIEQRLKEFEQVNDEIEQARNESNKLEELSQKTQIELLAEKLERSKNVFEILKFQSLAKRYDEVATNKFRPSLREEQAIKALEDSRTQNAIVEEIIDRIRQDNP